MKHKTLYLMAFVVLLFIFSTALLHPQGIDGTELGFRSFETETQFKEFLEIIPVKYGYSYNYGSRPATTGDVNGDGSINIVDALLVAQYSVGLRRGCATGDVNGDGIINIVDALMIAQYYVGLSPSGFGETSLPPPVTGPDSIPTMEDPDYSTTNIQEAGVDEADYIKTDGYYIYNINANSVIISRAYPAQEAEIINTLNYNSSVIQISQLYLYGDKLVVIGKSGLHRELPNPYYEAETDTCMISGPKTIIYNCYMTKALVYDISDRRNVALERTLELDGDYLDSRRIGNVLYIMATRSMYQYGVLPDINVEAPLYRDSLFDQDYQNLPYNEIEYLPYAVRPYYINVAALDLDDNSRAMQVKSLIAPAFNCYVSQNNMYVVFKSSYASNFNMQLPWFPSLVLEPNLTYIYKMQLQDLDVSTIGVGAVPGYILNQFSMSEYGSYFRIATTKGAVAKINPTATNNIYVLNEDMQPAGSLEDLAPGEKIYAARFVGERGYIVTFQKIDPFFVIDLADPYNPAVLGELKIPGYSDYLHPYDENHIIGLGKDTVAADSGNFAWFQGIKLAVFDVTDVTNPVVLHDEVIGHRGTTSIALKDYKAFLFSRSNNLLVLPVTLAEFEAEPPTVHSQAPITFQGAYVYNLTLEDGFSLKGRVSHSDHLSLPGSTGSIFSYNRQITRSLYIEDTLYTLSRGRLQLNDLTTLERIKAFEF